MGLEPISCSKYSGIISATLIFEADRKFPKNTDQAGKIRPCCCFSGYLAGWNMVRPGFSPNPPNLIVDALSSRARKMVTEAPEQPSELCIFALLGRRQPGEAAVNGSASTPSTLIQSRPATGFADCGGCVGLRSRGKDP